MKRVLWLLTAVCILSGLCACGADGKGQTQALAPPSAASYAAEPSPEAAAIAAFLKDTTYLDLADAAGLAPYYEAAAQRKAAILGAPTSIVRSDTFVRGETYTGTAYYISPTGNDEHDGLSPETAWRDPLRCTWGEVQPGDAVFFERGGVYRLAEASLRLGQDVTYSAYGEGPKPVFTIAAENSARSECWELWHEGAGGAKIWKYYKPTHDVGGIVFNDESYARRVLEWPTPNGWLAVDVLPMDPVNGIVAREDPCTNIQVASAGEYRTVEESLTEDMTYISRVDISGLTYPFEASQAGAGELYLRCDKGNPGECFADIEVIFQNENDTSVLDGWHADGYVLDNLSVKYYLDNAVNGNLMRRDAVIQNCTVEWGGNRLFSIESEEPTNDYFLMGDGIYGVAANATIRNNYMRHCGNACTFESSMELLEDMGTYTVEGNLMENCGQGIRVSLINEGEENRFDAVLLRDNIILDSGNGMNNACLEEPVAIDLGVDFVQYAGSIEVCNNVLIGSTLAMVKAPHPDAVKTNIHNNTIAQSENGALLTMGYSPSGDGISWYTMSMVKTN